MRANERFGGRGYRRVVCDQCRKLPKVEQNRVLLIDEMSDFLAQKNISAKNIARLEVIAKFEIPEVAAQAGVLREIAQVYPRRRKRWAFLCHHYPQLLQRAIEVGLLCAFEDWDKTVGAYSFGWIDDEETAPWERLKGLEESSCAEMSLDELNLLLQSLRDEELS